jgi:hypothetical protein
LNSDGPCRCLSGVDVLISCQQSRTIRETVFCHVLYAPTISHWRERPLLHSASDVPIEMSWMAVSANLLHSWSKSTRQQILFGSMSVSNGMTGKLNHRVVIVLENARWHKLQHKSRNDTMCLPDFFCRQTLKTIRQSLKAEFFSTEDIVSSFHLIIPFPFNIWVTSLYARESCGISNRLRPWPNIRASVWWSFRCPWTRCRSTEYQRFFNCPSLRSSHRFVRNFYFGPMFSQSASNCVSSSVHCT